MSEHSPIRLPFTCAEQNMFTVYISVRFSVHRSLAVSLAFTKHNSVNTSERTDCFGQKQFFEIFEHFQFTSERVSEWGASASYVANYN